MQTTATGAPVRAEATTTPSFLGAQRARTVASFMTKPAIHRSRVAASRTSLPSTLPEQSFLPAFAGKFCRDDSRIRLEKRCTLFGARSRRYAFQFGRTTGPQRNVDISQPRAHCNCIAGCGGRGSCGVGTGTAAHSTTCCCFIATASTDCGRRSGTEERTTAMHPASTPSPLARLSGPIPEDSRRIRTADWSGNRWASRATNRESSVHSERSGQIQVVPCEHVRSGHFCGCGLQCWNWTGAGFRPELRAGCGGLWKSFRGVFS